MVNVGAILKHVVLPGTYAIIEKIDGGGEFHINMFVMDLSNESISVKGIDLAYGDALELLEHWKLIDNQFSKQLKLMLL